LVRVLVGSCRHFKEPRVVWWRVRGGMLGAARDED
jgi:hypothetical protein